jgi:hypothetical protein
MLLEQEDGPHEQVVEVDGIVLRQLPLVRLVDPGGRFVVVVRGLALRRGDIGQLVLRCPIQASMPFGAKRFSSRSSRRSTPLTSATWSARS